MIRFPVSRNIKNNLGAIREMELQSGGFLGRTLRNLRSKDADFQPIFALGEIMFLSGNCLQAESYSQRFVPLCYSAALRIFFSSLMAKNEGLLLHASGIVKDGFAYLFLGRDGAGKTTAANLSKRYLILGDDQIAVRNKGGRFLAYPAHCWGERKFNYSSCQQGFPVRAVFFIKRATKLSFNPLSRVRALSRLLHSSDYIHYLRYLTDDLAKKAFSTSYELFKQLPCFEMRFTKKDNFWPELEKSLKDNY
ncbi:MAG: hypothetical protein Q8N14_02845 [Candidatus Omnitrophota bacterium]|nr:hypothetical protein [Candidatus Omnitrophota bacterium]